MPRGTDGSALPPPRPGWVLAALCAADFLVLMDGFIVAVALPTMQQALDISPVSLQWVVTAYILCFGGFLLLGGRLGDLYGRRRVLLVGLTVFAAGALLAGLAWNAYVLVIGRAVQGLAAALMAPTALALLFASFPEGPSRLRALGWWSAAGSVGIPAGALLGGLLTGVLGWRWVLLINVPAAVLAALGTRSVVPESYDRSGPTRLDVAGAVLVTGGIALVIFAVVQTERLGTGSASSAIRWVLPPLTAGILLLLAFRSAERRTTAALLSPHLLRTPGLLLTQLVGAALPIGLGGLLFLSTLYLQRVLGFTAVQTGLAYVALALPVIPASPAASWLVPRLGCRSVAVLGFVLQTGGLVLLARAPVNGTFLTDVLPGFVLVGAGAPIAYVPAAVVAMGTLHGQSGLASGIFNTSQQIGNALGLAALATAAAAWTGVLLDRGLEQFPALTGGYRAGYLLTAAITLAAALAALRLPRAPCG